MLGPNQIGNKIKQKGLKGFLRDDIFIRSITRTRDFYWKILKSRSNGEYKIANILGHKMYLDFNDMGISKALLIDKKRELDGTKETQRILKEGDIVLDIGANIGYYVLLEAREIGDKGHIFAVEPIPSNIEILKKNVELNGYENVETFNFAFGEKKSTDSLFLSDMSNQASLLKSSVLKESGFGEIKVNIETVDDFLKDKKCPNFIRMDVEGYESNILRGAVNTLKNKNLSKLFLEVHIVQMGVGDTRFLFSVLKEHGFEIEFIKKAYGTNWVIYEQLFDRFNKEDKIYESYTIDDVLNDEEILSGKIASFHVFFSR